MVLTTLYVAVLAVAIAAPLGIMAAIFLNYFAANRLTRWALAFIDLLAGVPSVIFGFIGLLVVVQSMETWLGMSAGESVLAAALVLAVMLLPFVISTYSESIQKAKARYHATSVALGLSPAYVARKMLLPATKCGAGAAIVLAFGRATSETIAVMMVIGNAPIFPRLLGRGQTVSGLTALEMGSAEVGSLHASAIYGANAVMLGVLALILLGTYGLKRLMHEKM